MNKSFPRSNRVADLIKEEVAQLLLFGVKDPRIQGLTVTDVRLKDDLKIARIYYVSSQNSERQGLIDGLERAKGFIRTELARKINIKRIPQIEFYYDEVFENGLRFEEVFNNIKNGGENGDNK